MQARRLWWFDVCAGETIADFRRRGILWLELPFVGTEATADGRGEASAESRFERDLRVGDLVLVGDRARAALLVGEITGEATRRATFQRLLGLRSMRWICEAPETDCASGLVGQTCESAKLTPLDARWLAPIEHLCAKHADGTGESALRFEIDCAPPAVALPQIPTLYQSPYAERILADFRWREYLVANPDIGLTGEGEAHAFHHFFHQGYYERRIFDPKRLDVFDPGFYRARYPELALASDAEAQIHYCYQGYYEQRLPNHASAWVHDADLHVFQMGKVGSHAIAEGLCDAGYAGRAVHLHWASDILTGYPGNRLPYSRVLVHARERPVKVMSGTREIVSWTLSGLFQSHGAATLNPNDAVAMVEERFWETCKAGLRWFDHRYFCDLDVYAFPFDHAAGHTRIEHAGIEFLIYRQEDLSRLAQTLGDFLDLPGFALPRRNEGEGKAYAALYARVMREFRLPGNVLASLYDTAYMRHFYTDAEREAGFARWVRGDEDAQR
ncbi:MAG: hypothetical protein E6Q88_00745 [Lysobacteraceae bacterium]|nr:MAG: hypothetical protein E6Q88_00745 [Xanthomonadaceae bacterium]